MNALTGFWAAVAIVGGTVHPGDGPPLKNATVVIEGDRIVAVGQDVQVPDGAQVVDARGKVVTPGLFDAYTQLGLVEVWAAAISNDGDAGGTADVRAAQRAVDSFNPDGTVIPIQRAHGVTTVLSAPGGGVVGGQAGVFDLVEQDPAVKPLAGVTVFLGGDQLGSRGARINRLRQAIEDARAYEKDARGFEKNQFRRTDLPRRDLEALGPVVRGEVPLLVSVHRKADLLAVVDLADELDVRVVLVGASEAWQIAARLGQAKIPVIIDPVVNLPVTFDAVHARADSAKILAQAGVPLMLSTFSAHNVRKLRQWAGNAVREGMPHPDALRAITATPAEVFGLDDRGTLAAGKQANLVVWSGDPFELSSRAEQVVIGGRTADLDHRQRALFRRYRSLPPTW